MKRRNEIKDIFRKQMISQASTKTEKTLAYAANKWAEGRNHLKYGDKLDSNVEWFLKNSNKGYDEVVAGASRASDDVTRFFAITDWGLLP